MRHKHHHPVQFEIEFDISLAALEATGSALDVEWAGELCEGLVLWLDAFGGTGCDLQAQFLKIP